MSVMFEELVKSSPFAIIDLFELHLVTALHGSNEIYRFHNGNNGKFPTTGDIIWKGNSYMAMPIEVDGFEYSGSGTLPRPRVRVANLLSTISAILININEVTPGNDLTGAKFVRIRTLSRFLDAVNFDNNENPYGLPDPDAEAPQEIYYVDRKVAENRDFVEFELAGIFDLQGVRAPKRQCISNICQWQYRSAECGYTGTNYFDENDNPLSTAPATNFPAGTDRLNAGDSLYSTQQIVSSNRWYILSVGQTGDVFIRAKNQQVSLGSVWRTGTSNTGGYRLTMQGDGNLALYTLTGAFVWHTNTGYLGTPSDVRYSLLYFDDGTPDPARSWAPYPILRTQSGDLIRNGYQGHRLAFFHEIMGSAVTYAGQTRTQSYSFTVGTRSITLQFTAQSVALTDHWSGQSYGWVDTTSGSYPTPTVTGNTGLFRRDENFQGSITLSGSNPFRATPFGDMNYVAATFFVAASTNYANRAIIGNDGNFTLINPSSTVIWDAGYTASTEPRVNTDDFNPLDDVCGKRLSSCKARFGENAELPYGSFPGIGTLAS